MRIVCSLNAMKIWQRRRRWRSPGAVDENSRIQDAKTVGEMFRLSATLASRHHSVAKFHGRPLRLFADEFRLRITSAAGADAGSGMMRYSVGVELHVFLFLSSLTKTRTRKVLPSECVYLDDNSVELSKRP